MSNFGKFSGSAKSIWNGSFLHGKGIISSTSSKSFQNVKVALPAAAKNLEEKTDKYQDDELDSNPEELISAALSTCFNITFSAAAGKHKVEVKSIETEAKAVMEKSAEGYNITDFYLTVNATLSPSVSDSKFNSMILIAKERCAISKLISDKCKVHIESKQNIE